MFQTIEITIKASMETAERKGKSKDAQEHGTAGFPEKIFCQPVRLCVDDNGTEQRNNTGNSKPGKQNMMRFPSGRSITFCHIFGNGRLQSGCGEGERECQNRSSELEKSDSFRPECLGKENTVKKTDQSGEHAGKGEKNRTLDERGTQVHESSKEKSLQNYMHPQKREEPFLWVKCTVRI